MLFGAYAVTFFMGAWSLLHMSYMGRPSRRDLVILGVNATMFALALSVSNCISTESCTRRSHPYPPARCVERRRYAVRHPREGLGWAVQGIQHDEPPGRSPLLYLCHANVDLRYVYGGHVLKNPSIVSDFRHVCQIYRAFVIWERQWKVIALPLILLILDASAFMNLPQPPCTDHPYSSFRLHQHNPERRQPHHDDPLPLRLFPHELPIHRHVARRPSDMAVR